MELNDQLVGLETVGTWGAIHKRWSHVRYDIGRTTDVVATIRPIHESSRKNKRIVHTIRPARLSKRDRLYINSRLYKVFLLLHDISKQNL